MHKPAAKPPAGVTPDFNNPPSLETPLIVVVVLFVAISSFFVAMRLYTRHFVLRKLWWDDCKQRSIQYLKESVLMKLQKIFLSWHGHVQNMRPHLMIKSDSCSIDPLYWYNNCADNSPRPWSGHPFMELNLLRPSPDKLCKASFPTQRIIHHARAFKTTLTGSDNFSGA